MIYEYKKKADHFNIVKDNKLILLANKKPFRVYSEKMANYIILELKKNKFVDQVRTPITSLSFFASGLTNKDRIKIIKYLIKMIHFDNVLYSTSVNEELKKIMNKSYRKYILEFETFFSLKLKVIYNTLGMQTKLKTKRLLIFFKNLDNFSLSLFYKLVQHSKSVILSFFFISKKFGITKFENLCNLENNFQQRLWKITDEQKLINLEEKKKLKNYVIFFKLLN